MFEEVHNEAIQGAKETGITFIDPQPDELAREEDRETEVPEESPAKKARTHRDPAAIDMKE